MFGMKLKKTKLKLFSSKKIMTEMERITQRVFKHFGGYVRKVARSSIKTHKKRRTSGPGDPPESHTGFLREHIYYDYDQAGQTVVIGPVRLSNTQSNAPETLEYGGSVILKRGKKKGQSVNIAPRPYMGPAAVEGRAKLPEFWLKHQKK